MPVDLIAEIKPKNSAFQHLLDAQHINFLDSTVYGTFATRPAASATVIGCYYMATDRASTLYICNTSSTWVPVNPRVVRLEWYIDGRLRADAAAGQGPIRYLPTLDGITDESVALWKPVIAKAHIRTAPAGAAVLVQIEFGITSAPATVLFAAANRLSIAIAGTEAISTTFADSAIENGSAFEIVVDQVGSTVLSEGFDLSVSLEAVQIDG